MSDFDLMAEYLSEEWSRKTLEDLREEALVGGGIAYQAITGSDHGRRALVICITDTESLGVFAPQFEAAKDAPQKIWTEVPLVDALMASSASGDISGFFSVDENNCLRAVALGAAVPISVLKLEEML